VFRRFSRWSAKGVWWRIFEAMSDDPDFEYLNIDSTVVRAHQHAAGAKIAVQSRQPPSQKRTVQSCMHTLSKSPVQKRFKRLREVRDEIIGFL
jgi:hypothetical protein